MGEQTGSANWFVLCGFGVLLLALCVVLLRTSRERLLENIPAVLPGRGPVVDTIRVVKLRVSAVVCGLMAVGMIIGGIVMKVTEPPGAAPPPVSTGPFAPYDVAVGEGLEQRDAPGNALPVALYTTRFEPDDSYIRGVPGMPDNANLVLATIYHPTHVVVTETADSITVTAYIDCSAASAPPVTRDETACAGAPFERGPGVTLLPVDLAAELAERTVVDGADGTVLEAY